MLDSFDDHDYGGNDRGRELTEREERIDVPKDSPRWERKGVYSSIEFVGQGQDNNIVKVIFLDTRWHRERHCIPSVGSNPYVPYGALVAVSRELSLLLLVHLDVINFTHCLLYSV